MEQAWPTLYRVVIWRVTRESFLLNASKHYKLLKRQCQSSRTFQDLLLNPDLITKINKSWKNKQHSLLMSSNAYSILTEWINSKAKLLTTEMPPFIPQLVRIVLKLRTKSHQIFRKGRFQLLVPYSLGSVIKAPWILACTRRRDQSNTLSRTK